MTHPLFSYLSVLSPAERRDRQFELDWLFELPAPRKPRAHRKPPPQDLAERGRGRGVFDVADDD